MQPSLTLFFTTYPPRIVAQAEEERASAAGSEKEEAEEEEEEEEYDEEEEEEDDDRPAKKPRHGGFILDEAGELPVGGVQRGPLPLPPAPLSAPIPQQTLMMSTRTRTSGRMGPRTSWRKVRSPHRGFGGSPLWLRGPPLGLWGCFCPAPCPQDRRKRMETESHGGVALLGLNHVVLGHAVWPLWLFPCLQACFSPQIHHSGAGGMAGPDSLTSSLHPSVRPPPVCPLSTSHPHQPGFIFLLFLLLLFLSFFFFVVSFPSCAAVLILFLPLCSSLTPRVVLPLLFAPYCPPSTATSLFPSRRDRR